MACEISKKDKLVAGQGGADARANRVVEEIPRRVEHGYKVGRGSGEGQGPPAYAIREYEALYEPLRVMGLPSPLRVIEKP